MAETPDATELDEAWRAHIDARIAHELPGVDPLPAATYARVARRVRRQHRKASFAAGYLAGVAATLPLPAVDAAARGIYEATHRPGGPSWDRVRYDLHAQARVALAGAVVTLEEDREDAAARALFEHLREPREAPWGDQPTDVHAEHLAIARAALLDARF